MLFYLDINPYFNAKKYIEKENMQTPIILVNTINFNDFLVITSKIEKTKTENPP